MLSSQALRQEIHGMQARLFGFVWQLGDGISLEEFMAHLRAKHKVEVKFGSYDRLLYLGDRDNYLVGVFLTIKDQRKFCEISNNSGEYRVAVTSLADGKNLVDFNFFAINKTTGHGVYQHYHNSCSLNQFCFFCKREYDDLHEIKVESDLASIAGGASPVQIRSINKKYKGSLKWQMMVRSESLTELIQELEKIGSFEFELATLPAAEPKFTPLTPFIKKETHTFRFTPGTGIEVIRRTISSAVKDLGITRGKVSGRDSGGLEKILRLMENPDSFGRYEYEELADETVLNLEAIEKSTFFDKVFEAIAANRGLFE
jgi:hypothetical protein